MVIIGAMGGKAAVYILTNCGRGVLYIGATRNLSARMDAHKRGIVDGFASKYRCRILVHAEFYDDWNSAIVRERQLKKWRRERKDALIRENNPDWRDLSEEIG